MLLFPFSYFCLCLCYCKTHLPYCEIYNKSKKDFSSQSEIFFLFLPLKTVHCVIEIKPI